MADYRTRKETLKYRKYLQDRKREGKHLDCIFCELNPGHTQFLEEYDHFYLVDNLFKYSTWDGQAVDEHIMLVPKKHTDTLSDLSDEAAVEYFRRITDFEDQGYHVYARGRGAVTKSITHQHTHLIKPAGKPHRIIFFSQKPYIRIAK